LNYPYRALLFDFDYTLADSGDAIAFCFNQALQESSGDVVNDLQIKTLIGTPLRQMYQHFLPDSLESAYETFIQAYRSVADRHMANLVHLFPGVRELVQWCCEEQVKIAIVSTKSTQRIKQILEKADLLKHFGLIVGSDDVDKLKPDPEGLLKALSILKLEKQQVVYVGDSVIDAKAAFAASVDFVAVCSGMTQAQAFTPWNPLACLSNVGQLQQFLDCVQDKPG